MAVAALVVVLAACSGGAVTTVATTGTSVTGTTDDAAMSTGSTGAGSRSAASSTTTPESTTSTTSASGGDVVEIVIENGEVVGGTRTLDVTLGDVVHLLVVSDTEDHVHVHGYDLFFDLVPGSETEIMFTADVPGIFEIELEGSHLLLIELEVS